MAGNRKEKQIMTKEEQLSAVKSKIELEKSYLYSLIEIRRVAREELKTCSDEEHEEAYSKLEMLYSYVSTQEAYFDGVISTAYAVGLIPKEEYDKTCEQVFNDVFD